MKFGLQGRRAFVGGSTSGIGATTARMLAEQGASVVVHGRDRTRGDALVAEITALGGTAIAVFDDLDDDASVAALCAETDEALGGIGILVCNAGDAQPSPPTGLPSSPRTGWVAMIATSCRRCA